MQATRWLRRVLVCAVLQIALGSAALAFALPTERISSHAHGEVGAPRYAAMTPDANFVVIEYWVPVLPPRPNSVWLYDRRTGAAERVDVDNNGQPLPAPLADNGHRLAGISDDGQRIALNAR